MKCELDLTVEDEDCRKSCDGCGRTYEPHETYVDNIDSCCGGCKRSLCTDCVKAAAKMVKEAGL